MVQTNAPLDLQRPSATRPTDGSVGLTQALPSAPIKTSATGYGHVELESTRIATSGRSSPEAPRAPVRQAGHRDEPAHTRDRVGRRATTSSTEDFYVVAEGVVRSDGRSWAKAIVEPVRLPAVRQQVAAAGAARKLPISHATIRPFGTLLRVALPQRSREPHWRGSTTNWSAENWCRALQERFFTERSNGLPVLFFVDEDVLTELYGGNAHEAIDSITDVVRQRLMRPGSPSGYFDGFERDGRRWRRGGGEGWPPFLHLLAVCVLAATRMGTGSVAPHNYYAQLRALLQIDDAGMPRGFDDSLDLMWGWYTWWLDDLLQGAHGLSTVAAGGRLTHIGKPMSQTLFRSADVRRLGEFFRWIHLEPGEDVEADLLVAYFRAWAPGQDLSSGAQRLLGDTQYWPTLGGILGAYARQWDGTRPDREGGRTVRLRIVVKLRMPRSVSIQAIQPEGYPDRLAGQLGGSAASAAATDGVFVVQNAIDPRQLTHGGSIGNDASKLTLPGSDIYVLQLDPELGGWASVDSFVPGERHFVLAGPSVAESVEEQLRHWSTEAISAQPAPARLSSWRLFGNVVLQGGETLEGALGDRRPTFKHRFAFHGGLPLETPRSYLSGGAPDVWLPPTTDVSLSLTLDGAALDAASDKVRLADHLPQQETTSHVIGYGDAITRTISVIESTRFGPPAHDQPAHVLETQDSVRASALRMVARIEDANDTAIRVVGPHVAGAVDRWSAPPLLLRRHAEQAWLLGKEPSEIVLVEKPPKPAWMTRQRLTGHLYEARAPFPVQYSIERWPSGELKARQRGRLEPGDLVVEGDAPTWTKLLLGAELSDGDPDLWAEYQAAAELLDGEINDA